jgi:hypothetical protein
MPCRYGIAFFIDKNKKNKKFFAYSAYKKLNLFFL